MPSNSNIQIPNPSITNKVKTILISELIMLCQHLDYKIEAARFPPEMINTTTVNKTKTSYGS